MNQKCKRENEIMQKKFVFVKITKTGAALCCAFVLMLLILACPLLKPTAKAEISTAIPGNSSMYNQLKNLSLPDNVGQKIETKMNNSVDENSNLVPESKENDAIDKSPGYIVETVRVLYADTGEVKDMSLEEYTLCSLVAEMPQSFHAEALKAQAVACRTFAVKSKLSGNKHKNADICSDYRCCQSMRKPDKIDFDISKARDAVRATDGIIAVYNGEPILAAYHSSSVGYTKSSEAVWGGSVEYLVPVIAAERKESASKSYTFSAEALTKKLEKYGITDTPRFFNGNDGLCAGAVCENITVTPSQIKKALGLRSSSFDVSVNGSSYTFKTYGYGHGVGMSQYGADALGDRGYDFYEILKYYYTGIGFDFAC